MQVNSHFLIIKITVAVVIGWLAAVYTLTDQIKVNKLSYSSKCFHASKNFNWLTFTREWNIKKTCKGSKLVRIPLNFSAYLSGAFRILYSTEGFNSVIAKVAKSGQFNFRKRNKRASSKKSILVSAKLLNTSPGIIPKLLPIEQQDYQLKKTELHLSLKGKGILRLASVQHISTQNLLDVYKDGWLFSLLHNELIAVLVLIATLLFLILKGQISSFDRCTVLTSSILFCSGGIAQALQGGTNGTLFVFFSLIFFSLLLLSFAAWEWLSIISVIQFLPRPVEFGGRMNELLSQLFKTLRPDGFLMNNGKPENLKIFTENLNPIWALGPEFMMILALLIIALVIQTGKNIRLKPAALAALFVSLVVFILHPTYHLIRDPQRQQTFGLLVLSLIALQYLALSKLGSSTSKKIANLTADILTRKDLLIFSVISFLFTISHLCAVLAPFTWNSDEFSETGTGKAILIELSDPATVHGMIAIILSIICLSCLVYAIREKLCKRAISQALVNLWICTLLMGSFFLVLCKLPTIHSDFALFRYPPLSKLFYGFLWFKPSLFESLRFINVLVMASAGLPLFLAIRVIGLSRLSAFFGLSAFYASFLVFYWAGFVYSVPLILLVYTTILLLFLLWAKFEDGIYLEWCGVALLAAYFIRESIIGVVLVIIAASIAVSVARYYKHNKIELRPLVFLLLAVVPAVSLWQGPLVASWFGWIGRTYPVNSFLILLSESERWRLTPWVFLNSNGALLFGLVLLGALVLFKNKSFRWAATLMGVLFLGDYVLYLVMGRMREYDGHSRFLVTLMIPSAIFAAGALESIVSFFNQQALLIVPKTLAVLLTLALWYRSPFNPEKIACVPAIELNPLVQSNGNDQGFFPEAAVVQSLESHSKTGEGAVLLAPYAIASVMGRLHQIAGTTDLEPSVLHQKIKGLGFQYLIVPFSPDYYCHKKLWAIVDSWKASKYSNNPRLLTKGGYFKLVDTVSVGQTHALILRLKE